jgi:hypothetical protein
MSTGEQDGLFSLVESVQGTQLKSQRSRLTDHHVNLLQHAAQEGINSAGKQGGSGWAETLESRCSFFSSANYSTLPKTHHDVKTSSAAQHRFLSHIDSKPLVVLSPTPALKKP